jgi:hypothetical protein
VRDNIGYADGWNVNLGKETVDRLEITLYVKGNVATRDNHAPHIVTREAYSVKGYEAIKAAGGYARLGDAYINEENYNRVMAAITEVEVEAAGDAEFAQIKAEEQDRDAREESAAQAIEEQCRRDIKNGLCPKCGTWCYGDCEAN